MSNIKPFSRANVLRNISDEPDNSVPRGSQITRDMRDQATKERHLRERAQSDGPTGPAMMSDGKTPMPRTLADAKELIEQLQSKGVSGAATKTSAASPASTAEVDALNARVKSQGDTIVYLSKREAELKSQLAAAGVNQGPRTLKVINEQRDALHKKLSASKNQQEKYKIFLKLKELEVESKSHAVVRGKDGDKEYVCIKVNGHNQWTELKPEN